MRVIGERVMWVLGGVGVDMVLGVVRGGCGGEGVDE